MVLSSLGQDFWHVLETVAYGNWPLAGISLSSADISNMWKEGDKEGRLLGHQIQQAVQYSLAIKVFTTRDARNIISQKIHFLQME